MVITLLPITTLLKPVQFQNAYLPMLVTVLGIVILVKLKQKENAFVPMPVTGTLLTSLGMTTAPPGPEYPVIVIAPLVTP